MNRTAVTIEEIHEYGIELMPDSDSEKCEYFVEENNGGLVRLLVDNNEEGTLRAGCPGTEASGFLNPQDPNTKKIRALLAAKSAPKKSPMYKHFCSPEKLHQVPGMIADRVFVQGCLPQEFVDDPNRYILDMGQLQAWLMDHYPDEFYQINVEGTIYHCFKNEMTDDLLKSGLLEGCRALRWL